ncbi:MAG: type II/IV secretion system protein [Candidatus Moranbacteria bacterium]|nr:type II/IV secretion system protein [Candidatus Moranbacteria bacterium]
MVRIIKKNTADSYKEKTSLQTQETLKQLSRQSEELHAERIAKTYNLPYIDLYIFPSIKQREASIPEEEAKKYNCAVFQKTGKTVRIATTQPSTKGLVEYLTSLENNRGWQITLYVVSRASLNKAWNIYTSGILLERIDTKQLDIDNQELNDFEKELKDLFWLKKTLNETPITDVLETIAAGAIKMKASDIHFEPEKENLRLRYRLDGVLHTITTMPSDIHKRITSRVKIMSGMKLNIRDTAQDGRFSIIVEDKEEIDMRVSIIPGNYGETIVMRLLDKSMTLLDIGEMGIRDTIFEEVLKQIKKPNGAILTTGPTGSGKTTTLYAILNSLNNEKVKIITIEDPIEYEIAGISQTQVNRTRGYTFAKGLRAIVRQDPDIILVGEIRDDETGDIAINAALTGHLVLSTLHTNDAIGTIPRLMELGVKPHLIIEASNILMAQRLVRRLCPHCKEKYTPAEQTEMLIKKLVSIISPKAKIPIPKDIPELYRAKGCVKCFNTGYKGRIGIFEVLALTERIKKAVLDFATQEDLARTALEEGMLTMTQDGILKVIEGVTDMEEIWRVTAQQDFLQNVYDDLMEQTLGRFITTHEETIEEIAQKQNNIATLTDIVEKTEPENILEAVLAAGLIHKASDVHIEPRQNDIAIRLRIDGALKTIATIPNNEYPIILGKIKLLCHLDTAVRAGVKDGRFTIRVPKEMHGITDTEIDVRVSIILGGYGETVVMRLLNKTVLKLDLNNLGFRKHNLDRILKAIKNPNGIILNTGPTGSGKTTTLYSILKVLNKPEVKIITVEDPIEYKLEGILQTQVSSKDNYTFDSALRVLLRQNPNIMMIGEIRDNETANVAIQASLTGHLILSTVHTNDASGAVQRLLNMGISTDAVANASIAFIAQRLVRTFCETCKKSRPIKPEEQERLEEVLKTISPASGITIPQTPQEIFEPAGCDECGQLGFKGQTIVSEVILIDREIQELIARGALSREIADKAIQNGTLTMAQDGALLITEGRTTLDEVDRVTKQ